MSEAREAILGRLEAACAATGAAPTRVAHPAMPPDPEATLQARLELAGGHLQRATVNHWPTEIDWPLELAAVEHLYSSDAALPARGIAAGASHVHDLAPLEVCVLRAEFAVVENGAAWHIPRSPLERASALLAEHLVILVDQHALVPTLHQAYQRIDLRNARFGWFLCGPSKTADIEQALVLGAHGPRTMSLVLVRS
ncbi:MAG: hypothetical protein GY910_19475 [bacterium]|nr:hypothetical protein [Deltaproteobacteria bacterium]MCP4907162.1 hypothetical protein [bacterium]